MSMYHVKADGSMGNCTAKEGHCPFGGDSGTKHFTSITEAQAYAEKIIRDTTDHNGGMKMTKTKDEESPTPTTDNDEPKENTYGLAVTTYPTTEHGVHWAAYPGWEGDDVIISSGGYVDGKYFDSSEVESLGLYDKLSEDVRDEMEPLRGDWPGNWNGKIIELKGRVSPEDEELLEALWISGEVYGGEVTVYGTDADVSEMNDADLHSWGLYRIATDDDEEDDEDDDEESPMGPASDDDEPRMTTNSYGLKVTTWPTTEQGCHSATYLGWGGDDDYEIVNAGGYVDGKYIPSHEVHSALFDKLSTEVRDEMESLDGPCTGGATPAEWNDKILELERVGVSPEDEKILDALWIEGECFNGSTTIYGTDDDVSEMDEADFRRLGLRRLGADELWHMGIIVDDDDDATEDEDE